MRMIQGKTVLLVCVIMSLFIASNTAFGAIKLGPGPKAVLKAYKDGDFDKARAIMEKWKAKKMKFEPAIPGSSPRFIAIFMIEGNLSKATTA